MKSVYLAGPFFSEEQVARIEKMEAALTSNPTVSSFFSPRSYEGEGTTPNSAAWAKQIYDKDMLELKQADVIVAILDYEAGITDPGTAYEIGAAFELDKPIVTLQETDAAVNLMITEATTAYLTTIDAIEAYDFEHLPEVKYVGDYI